MYVKFTKKKEMNVFIYEGDAGKRENALGSLVEDNAQVEIDKEYSVDIDKGIMVIAYPNKDKSTEFSFTYWFAPVIQPEEVGWYEFQGSEGEDLFMVLCGVAAILLIYIICVCCYCCSK